MRNGQAYQRKTEKFFVSEEKKFGKIDSRSHVRKSKEKSKLREAWVTKQLSYRMTKLPDGLNTG